MAVINGTSDADTISGLAGNDEIVGGGGIDHIDGGDGVADFMILLDGNHSLTSGDFMI